MKKIILTAFAAMLMAAPAVQAQKVNEGALLAKIAKSDADIADAKKGVKSATWINRGKAFYEAAAEPTKNLYPGMEALLLKTAVGDPQSVGTEVLNGTEYEAWVYPYFTAYVQGGKLMTWKQTKWVLEDAPQQAIAAYNKAYEIDPKSASKVSEGLKSISDFCSQMGNTGLDTGDYAGAASAYVLAYTAQSSPAYGGAADPVLIYYAGYLLTADGANNPESFVKGAKYLEQALQGGYTDEEGNIYYYLFHCYYGQKEADAAFVMKAKDALLAGMEKFPKNSRIIEALIQLYTVEEGVGDPADLVAMIDNTLKEQPENVDLWFGRGRVFYALKNADESIASFHKVVELKPEMFEGNYFLGIFYTSKAEDLQTELNSRQYSSQAAYDEDLKVVNAIYKDAIPWFEKAHEINPQDVNTLELLKSICFRLRYDYPEMSEKYETYNALFKQAQGQ